MSNSQSFTDKLSVIEITPDFSVSSQVFPTEIEQIKAKGYTRILCVRPDMEEDADEQPPRFLMEKECLHAGLEFSHIPIESGASYPEMAIRAAAHMFGDQHGKTLAFCLTGVRSVRLWALGSALAGTLPPSEILNVTKQAGFDLGQFNSDLNRLSSNQAPYYVADNFANMI